MICESSAVKALYSTDKYMTIHTVKDPEIVKYNLVLLARPNATSRFYDQFGTAVFRFEHVACS